MFLLDTNVISELSKGSRADRGVVDFLRANQDKICLPVQVIGELRGGVERLRRRNDLPQAARLESWLENVLDTFATRILAFDLVCAETWGRLMSVDQQNPVDRQMAAIALVYELTVVTRNTDHFDGTGVPVLNPFAADASPDPRLI